MMQSSSQSLKDGAAPGGALDGRGPPLAPPDDHVVDGMGTLSLSDNHAVYIGSSHWVTILEDVSLSHEKSLLGSLVTISPDSMP